MDISFTLIMFLIPLRSRTRCWPWLERKEHPIFTLMDLFSMHNDDEVWRQKFPQLTVICPMGKWVNLCSHWYNLIRGGEAGGRGKGRGGENNIITYNSFPVMRNNCSSYFFHACKIYRSRRLHLRWANNKIYDVNWNRKWLNLRAQLHLQIFIICSQEEYLSHWKVINM